MLEVTGRCSETEEKKAVEVTPDMIKAGIEVFRLGWSDEPEAGVEAIFIAMYEFMKK